MLETYAVRFWVIIACHLAMGGGTLAGRWRMVKTMGQRITKLNPFSVFAAKAAAALTLMGTAHFGIRLARGTPSPEPSSARANCHA
jgi:inorganic phosphate transporter, PiT family